VADEILLQRLESGLRSATKGRNRRLSGESRFKAFSMTAILTTREVTGPPRAWRAPSIPDPSRLVFAFAHRADYYLNSGFGTVSKAAFGRTSK